MDHPLQPDPEDRVPSDEGGEQPCALPKYADVLGYDDAGPRREPHDDLGYVVAVGLLEADLLLPLCRSLKDKRGILAKTMNHLRKKHAVSVAEVADHDTWGRAGLAVVTVSGSRVVSEQTLKAAARSLEHDREVQMINWSIQLL